MKATKLYCDVCGKNCNAKSFLTHEPTKSDDPFDQLAHATFSLQAQCVLCSSVVATVALTPVVMLTILTTPIQLSGIDIITFQNSYEAKGSTKD